MSEGPLSSVFTADRAAALVAIWVVDTNPSGLCLLHAEHVDLDRITKVGEGTFGEAFKVT